MTGLKIKVFYRNFYTEAQKFFDAAGDIEIVSVTQSESSCDGPECGQHTSYTLVIIYREVKNG